MQGGKRYLALPRRALDDAYASNKFQLRKIQNARPAAPAAMEANRVLRTCRFPLHRLRKPRPLEPW